MKGGGSGSVTRVRVAVLGVLLMGFACSSTSGQDPSGSPDAVPAATPSDPDIQDFCRLARTDPTLPTASSLEDLGSFAKPIPSARGSAEDPLPLGGAIPWSEPSRVTVAVDANGFLWTQNWRTLVAYDTSLRPVLRADVHENARFACGDAETYVAAPPLVEPGQTQPSPTLSIAAYDVSGIRATCPSGPPDLSCVDGSLSVPVRSRTFDTVAVPLGVWPSEEGLLVALRTPLGTQDYLEIDGARYVAPFPGPDAPRLTVALVAFDLDFELLDVVWLERPPLGIDQAGRLFWLGVLETDQGSALVLERRSASGELELERTLWPAASSSSRLVALSPRGDLYVREYGVAGPEVMFQHPLSTGRLFVSALDSDGEELWRHWFAGVGSEDVSELRPGPDGSLWMSGVFEEWIEIGAATAYGHVGWSPDAFQHQFVARFDREGRLSVLEAMGPVEFVPEARVIPLTPSGAYYAGDSYYQESVARDGPLVSPYFLGSLELDGSTTSEPPEVPIEELGVALPTVEPDFRSVHVLSGGDGKVYVVQARGNEFVFIEHPSGAASPIFYRPEPATACYSLALQGDLLFWYECGELRAGFEARPAILGVHDKSSGRWVATHELLNSDRPGDGASVGRHGLVSRGDWLFVGDAETVRGFRREATGWRAVGGALPGGLAIAVSERFLFAGAPQADSPRQDSGKVHVYEIASELTSVAALVASDAAPYDPGQGFVGDVLYGPPPGEGFGSLLAAEGDTLLVGNRDRKIYLFERDGEDFVERGQLDRPAGALAISGDVLLASDTSECRGVTCGSGAVYVYRRLADSWTPTERIAPSQRWQSQFGAALAFGSGQTALIGAPGYGSTIVAEAGEVFAHSLNGCEAPSCWGDWICR